MDTNIISAVLDKNTIPTLFSGVGLVAVTGICTGVWWIVSRIMSYQGLFKNIDMQFKHIDEKFKHLEDKMDYGFKHMNDKIDMILNTTKELLKSQNTLLNNQNDRISRMERNYDNFIEKKT